MSRRRKDPLRALPEVSTYAIWCVLYAADLSWQRDRSWCHTGLAKLLTLFHPAVALARASGRVAAGCWCANSTDVSATIVDPGVTAYRGHQRTDRGLILGHMGADDVHDQPTPS